MRIQYPLLKITQYNTDPIYRGLKHDTQQHLSKRKAEYNTDPIYRGLKQLIIKMYIIFSDKYNTDPIYRGLKLATGSGSPSISPIQHRPDL